MISQKHTMSKSILHFTSLSERFNRDYAEQTFFVPLEELVEVTIGALSHEKYCDESKTFGLIKRVIADRRIENIDLHILQRVVRNLISIEASYELNDQFFFQFIEFTSSLNRPFIDSVNNFFHIKNFLALYGRRTGNVEYAMNSIKQFNFIETCYDPAFTHVHKLHPFFLITMRTNNFILDDNLIEFFCLIYRKNQEIKNNIIHFMTHISLYRTFLITEEKYIEMFDKLSQTHDDFVDEFRSFLNDRNEFKIHFILHQISQNNLDYIKRMITFNILTSSDFCFIININDHGLDYLENTHFGVTRRDSCLPKFVCALDDVNLYSLIINSNEEKD